MALPTSYLTSTKNLPSILEAIRGAQAPERFTVRFLEEFGFKSNADRLMIGVLKSLRFLDDNGKPNSRYFEYLDETRSKYVLAEGLRDAYEDLFRINKNAQQMSNTEMINKMKTLSEGKVSDSVLKKMASTFSNLSKLADFSGAPKQETEEKETKDERAVTEEKEEALPEKRTRTVKLGGLVYNIQIVLPESRDSAVYDAIFQSLRKHLD